MNNTPINIDIPISVITRSVCREDALVLIKAIDLRFAECDFTLDVLRMLTESLKSDLTNEEIKSSLGL